jgi:hypothetical protein
MRVVAGLLPCYLGLDGSAVGHCKDGGAMAAGILVDGGDAAAESDSPGREVLGQRLDQVLSVQAPELRPGRTNKIIEWLLWYVVCLGQFTLLRLFSFVLS